jgi:hypothetical protein
LDWLNRAKEIKCHSFAIIKDLEDGEYFPVFFNDPKELEKYMKNIISESKLKVISVKCLK